ncbi:copper oxidase [Bifidobacterium aemilianum]|uniref:Copper oxidase n=1 Tax=Bifidobacterium aemilianum TaxID=2493120 RepID=A0A366K7H3_9BIFI|nr:polyphenol oxidase family protein [Bifidobacterium aemilianum]RBP97614.1 copper oxidase [Bifidobacterium aemilianum]
MSSEAVDVWAGQPGDQAIVDSSALSPTDKAGRAIPVTIPIALAPGVKVVYTTRLGGVSQGDFASCNLGGKGGEDPALVQANREALAQELGVDVALVSQVHSGRAVDMDELLVSPAAKVSPAFSSPAEGVDGPRLIDHSGGALAAEASPVSSGQSHQDGSPEQMPGAGRVIEADAQVSSQKGLALGVFAADCLPVLLADPEAGLIAAAHCGRKGLQRGIIASTVELMVAKGGRTGRMVATLGPCICGDCYEVGADLADDFDAQFPGSFGLSRFGGPSIDLALAARQGLAKAGIPRDSLIDSSRRVAAATQYLAADQELADLSRQDGEGMPDLAERLGEIHHSLCTLENPLWYSHRRAALAHKLREGRMLALIVRED